MSYSIEEHRHRFAAWAAARAASTSLLCRFSVEQGRQVLEDAGLAQVASIDNLPQPNKFDAQHRRWRERVIRSAKKHHQLPFTHGVAAKLINIYFKSIFVCGGLHEDPRVKAIHPPIDSVLLKELYKRNVGGQRNAWKDAMKARWSKLDSEQYETLIEAIRGAVPANHGLWEIEEHWVGYSIDRYAKKEDLMSG
ncbi:MAG: hypothetical protein IH991_13900 [Planctomycetes bacterium]|nr:hypothetical protein [Planctomycetota bacterium]